jgi:hypothetical protein
LVLRPAWPLLARAQRQPVKTVGILLPGTAEDPVFQARLAAFYQELALLGWTIGRNVRIEPRWATNASKLRRHAQELVALAPDVILATGDSTVPPLQQATHTIPIVFPLAGDPVGAGFVDSLARPGSNATGFMLFEYTMGGKWLELLKEIAPNLTRVAVLRDPANPSQTAQFGAMRPWPRRLGWRSSRSTYAMRARSSVALRISRARAMAASFPHRRPRPAASRSDHHACGQAQAARDLLGTFLRHQRWPDVARARSD